MVKLRYLFLTGAILILMVRAAAAATIEPLNNGYSAVPRASATALRDQSADLSIPSSEPQMEQATQPSSQDSAKLPPKTGALIEQPRPSMRLENEVDNVLSREDGVSAAIGAALTATLTSNPAAVLVGGLAGIWVGDKQSPGCDCEPMQLGEKASSLFRTVSKTMFKGGRYIFDGTKKIANKTGSTLKQMSSVNTPLPLQGQEPLMASDVDAKVPPQPRKTEPTAALPPVQKKQAVAPAASVKPKKRMPKKTAKTQPPVISSIGAKKQVKLPKSEEPKQASTKKMAEKALSEIPEAVKKLEVAAPKKVAKAAVKKQEPEPQAKPQKAPADEQAKQQAKERIEKAKPVLRASGKKLQAMPKLATAETLAPSEMTGANDQQWPEQSVTLEMDPAPVHRVLKAKPPVQDGSTKAYTAPAKEGQVQAAQAAAQTPDCEQGGDKIGRGRLAWMECYYRME